MKDLIRKGVLVGLGVTAITRDKVKKYVKELEKKGVINEKEGKKLVESLWKEAMKQRSRIENIVRSEAKKAIKRNKTMIGYGNKKIMDKIRSKKNIVIRKLNLATKNDIRALEKKIEKKAAKRRAPGKKVRKRK